MSHFTCFSVFSPYTRSYSVHFSFLHFSVFLAIFQVLPGDSLIFFVGQFSCHIPGPTGCISYFSSFSLFLAIFQVLRCVCVSFSTFFSFLTIIQALMCTFFIFHGLHCFSQYSRSYNVSVSFSTFFSFVAVIQVLQCLFLIFHVLHCFSPYSSSYSVFHFSRSSLFLSIF